MQTHPPYVTFLALSPKTPRYILRDLARYYPFLVGQNPRVLKYPEVLDVVLGEMEELPPHVLGEPRSDEGRAFRFLLANKNRLPPKRRRRLESLAEAVPLSR